MRAVTFDCLKNLKQALENCGPKSCEKNLARGDDEDGRMKQWKAIVGRLVGIRTI